MVDKEILKVTSYYSVCGKDKGRTLLQEPYELAEI